MIEFTLCCLLSVAVFSYVVKTEKANIQPKRMYKRVTRK